MCSLIKFELEKIWKRRDFAAAVSLLLLINLFLLWYTNLPDENTPPLSAYKAFQKEIDGMTEQEKGSYLESLREILDTMTFVQEILSFQQLSGDMKEYFLKQALESRPGVFEQNQESFQNGDYLIFTDSFYREIKLVDELCQEWAVVSAYGDYLDSIQESKNILNGVSIFSGDNTDSFSSRNIAKSANDYKNLTDSKICWMPGKPFTLAMESIWTDLLLLLSAFLFVCKLIFQEKERKLYYVTRSTRRGIYPSISGKLAALFIHCIAITFLLYGTNLLFFRMTAGLGAMKGFFQAPLQSVADYMGSSFSITAGQYILLSFFTKGVALFCISSVLTALCVLADNLFLPLGTTGILCGAGWALYLFFPAGSKYSVLKYINPAGVMRTEHLYGQYLNFNLFGFPISRTTLSWLFLLVFSFLGIVLSAAFFGQGQRLTLREKANLKKPAFLLRSGLSAGPWGHEFYKIMIASKALPVLVIFLLLTGYRELTREYNVSVKEQYYQDIMLGLEGELTQNKEDLVLAEKARFQEAFDNINHIDQMISDGKISEDAGENLKSQWYAVTAFYPSFQRIWQQYQNILETGGSFIYDTGYLYLFGAQHTDFAVNLLLLSLCTVFAFSNCGAMEYQSGAWRLINSSRQGKKRVWVRKAGICALTESVITLVPILTRAVNLSASFPMHGLYAPAKNIPYCSSFPQGLPLAFFLLLFVLAQILSLAVTALGVLLISEWRRDYIQTIFFAVVIFAAPLVLKLLGFAFAGWFSFYPLYSWTALL